MCWPLPPAERTAVAGQSTTPLETKQRQVRRMDTQPESKDVTNRCAPSFVPVRNNVSRFTSCPYLRFLLRRFQFNPFCALSCAGSQPHFTVSRISCVVARYVRFSFDGFSLKALCVLLCPGSLPDIPRKVVFFTLYRCSYRGSSCDGLKCRPSYTLSYSSSHSILRLHGLSCNVWWDYRL